MTNLKCISSDDCVKEQDNEENESLDEPEERLFTADRALLLNKSPLGRFSSFAACHHERSRTCSAFTGILYTRNEFFCET